MSPIPSYQQNLALELAMNRIEYSTKSFEHHTASWATTKISNHFNGDWLLTPEMILEGKKKPDMVVEKVENEASPKLALHAAFEFKRPKGTRFEDALKQLAEAIPLAVDSLGYSSSNDNFEIFAVVVIGTDIGFFEYHNARSNLDEEGIDHFNGCVSFTTSYNVDGKTNKILEDDQIPIDLKPLFYNEERLRTLNNPDKNQLREDAKQYSVPCVFSLKKHQKGIEFMFKHMVGNVARSSV